MTLLGELQQAAIDSSVPLANLLRKCKVLAARPTHKDFSKWIDHELNGYLPKRGDLRCHLKLAGHGCERSLTVVASSLADRRWRAPGAKSRAARVACSLSSGVNSVSPQIPFSRRRNG
jgi:hypothetical protein